MRWPTTTSTSPQRCAAWNAGSRPHRRATSTTPALGGFSTRPGRMWWSVPPGVEDFHTWQQTTTVFHEGVPGHHLQIGRAVDHGRPVEPLASAGLLGLGPRRGLGAVCRTADGRPRLARRCRNRMGMLDAQRFRAARVVIDIGMHCGLTAPDGDIWDAEKAWVFLQCTQCAQAEENTALRARPLPRLARSGAVVRSRAADLAATARRHAFPRAVLKEFHGRGIWMACNAQGAARPCRSSPRRKPTVRCRKARHSLPPRNICLLNMRG